MNYIFKVVLSLSISGSILILFFLVCKRLLKDRISRQWQYYIWIIVIARLLLPFAPNNNLVGRLFQIIDNATVYSTTIESEQQMNPDLKNNNSTEDKFMNQTNENVKKQTTSIDETQSLKDVISQVLKNIWLLWLLTAFVLLIRKITIYQSFVQYIKAGQIPISDTMLLDQLSILSEQLNVKRPIELCVNPLISSPLLIGFFHPCIVLPTTDLTDNDLQYTIMHELTHYRRLDMFYKWLVQIVLCLHWFNPLVHVLAQETNIACEFSCDEAIISKLDLIQTKEYGKTLLHAMANVGKYKENLACVTLSENNKFMKERLGAIMNFRKPSKLMSSATILLTLAICFVATYMGVYARENMLNRQPLNPIKSQQSKKSTVKTVVFEKVKYDKRGLHPHIYNITWNNTSKKIVGHKLGMLAFDKEGNPLKIKWNGLETNPIPTYHFLYEEEHDGVGYSYPVGRHYQPDSGWSLNEDGTDANAKKIEYVLYCFKELTFSDGKVWKNPNFNKWLKTYRGKKMSIKTLKNYYPYTHIISK